jgi:hypothetical protein
MVAYTTTYNLAKPTVGDDEDAWGGYLNGNFDTLESLLKGTTALTTIDVTGNITVGGNVDGRDIAADGTKLDGIEAGATADQTASEILTAIKTVDGSGSGLDADTIDGLQATSFLRSDTADTTSGNLTIATSGSATFTVETTSGSGQDALIKLAGARTSSSTSNIGMVEFINDTSSSYTLAQIAAQDPSGNHSNGNGRLVFRTSSGGTLSDKLVIPHTGDLTYDGNTVLTTADYDVQVCHLKTNVDASVTQGVANEFTVNFNLEEHNDTSTFSHSSGVVTVATAGWYRIVANLVYQNASASVRNTIRAYVKKNGTEVTSTATYDYDRGTTYGEFSNNKINTMLYLAANDTIEIANYGQNIDGSVTIQSEECELMISSETVQASSSNADTVDGLHASQFVRSDTADTMTGNLTLNGTLSLGSNVINDVEDIYLRDKLFHDGDTNTYLGFASDTINLVTAGQTEVQITNNGLHLVNSALHEDYDALSGTSVTIDPNTGGAWSLTMTGNTTFTFGTTTNNYSVGLVVELTGNGGTVTWPTSVDWAGGTAPDAPASGETDIYVFWTRDGGTTWYGVQSIDAAA